MFGVGEGHLVGAPETFQLVAIEFAWSGPALGGAQHHHGPLGPVGLAAAAGFLLDGADFSHRFVHGGGHGLVHGSGLTAFHKDRPPAVAPQQAFQLPAGNAGKDRWIGDLVAVEVQHRQHRPVADRVDELIDVPGGGQGAGFRFAIAHAGQGDQIGVVKDGAAGVGKHIAELAPLMDRAGGFRGAVAADVAGEGELFEKAFKADHVFRLVGIYLAVAAV